MLSSPCASLLSMDIQHIKGREIDFNCVLTSHCASCLSMDVQHIKSSKIGFMCLLVIMVVA